VFFTSGSLTAATLTLRPDVAWIAQTTLTVDTLGVLVMRPGSRMAFDGGSLFFTAGGTLNAVGEPAKFIQFSPFGSNSFFGLRFDSPGAGPNPALAPTAVSTMSYVRVDSATGQGTNDGICCFSGAISGARRHKLLLDSVIVRKSLGAGVVLSAKGSFMKRSKVDTTGNPSNNFASGGVGVALGDSTLLENSLVFRAGSFGVEATGSGTGARLNNVRIVASRDAALHVESGTLHTLTSGVRADSANAYPFYGRIENLAIIARTAALQNSNLLGNVDNVAVIQGGTLTNDTLEVSASLRWQVQNQVIIDTLAQIKPQPGADFTFTCCGLQFQRGGTLNAVGTNVSFIRFRPVPGNQWSGLRFDTPGQGPNPATAPTATSTMTYVRVDSATGQGVNTTNMCCFSAAVNGGVRHRLLMDSVIIHKAWNTAVALSGNGSYLKRSLIDTTGNVGSNYTTSQAAVALGDTTSMENSLIRRSGYTGLYVPGQDVVLTNVRVVASQNVGIQADGDIIGAASTNVKADSANAYPFYGRIENIGIIAPTAALQSTNLLGNTDNVALITGGNLTNKNLEILAALRWQVQNQVIIDTLAQLQPQPGADITFTCCGLQFQRGGTLNAVGTNVNFIRFRPVPGNNQWSGLRFDTPGQGPGSPDTYPIATSTMTYVRVDSATGQGVNTSNLCCFSAAVNGGTRHRLLMDSVIVHKAWNTAIALAGGGSYLKRSLVDTTGNIGSGYTNSQAALVVGDTVLVENTLVRRSGQIGIYAPRNLTKFTSVRVVASQNAALYADGGTLDPTTTGFKADSVNSYPFYGRIQNFGIIAATSALQTANLLGNVSDIAIMVGGVLTNRTVDAIPALKWQITQSPAIDTLSQLNAFPGADFSFYDGTLQFSAGGRLNAVGTTTNFIHFGPVPGNQWSGLRFDSPGFGGLAQVNWPRVTSNMTYVRVDSANGTGVNTSSICCYSAAIHGSTRHVLQLDSVIVHKAVNNAVTLAASGSYLNRSVIDTTGFLGSGYLNGQGAVAIGDSIQLSQVVIRRSGSQGLNLQGIAITTENVRVVASVGSGVNLYTANTTFGGSGGSGGQLVSDSSGGLGFAINNTGIVLEFCSATGNASHGAATTSTYQNVQIHQCDFVDNGGNAVNNSITNNATYVIDATNNYWGNATGPVQDTPNGVSANVNFIPVCAISCSTAGFAPIGQGTPPTPAIPPHEVALHKSRRRRRRQKRA